MELESYDTLGEIQFLAEHTILKFIENIIQLNINNEDLSIKELNLKCNFSETISIKSFIHRMVRYIKPEPEEIIMWSVLLYKLSNIISSNTIHKTLAGITMLVNKFHCDLTSCNTYFSKVSGITLHEINEIEIKILNLLNWNILISDGEFWQILIFLRNTCELNTCDDIINRMVVRYYDNKNFAY